MTIVLILSYISPQIPQSHQAPPAPQVPSGPAQLLNAPAGPVVSEAEEESQEEAQEEAQEPVNDEVHETRKRSKEVLAPKETVKEEKESEETKTNTEPSSAVPTGPQGLIENGGCFLPNFHIILL